LIPIPPGFEKEIEIEREREREREREEMAARRD